MSGAKAHLVIVDDDDMLRPVLVGNLRDAGYLVHDFPSPVAALTALTEGSSDSAKPDLLILDWRMPEMTGLDLLRRLRAAGLDSTALFFTSYNDTLYEEAALTVGAVDFIDKTRSYTILLKRIELILGRVAGPAEPETLPLIVGPLRLELGVHTALWRGRKVDLTYGEFRIVEMLARSGADVGYREIYDVVRGEKFVAGDGPDGYRANVRAMIKRIRQKFVDIDPSFAAIINYPGFGYRWGGDA
jgi:two-component system response regulator ChvI